MTNWNSSKFKHCYFYNTVKKMKSDRLRENTYGNTYLIKDLYLEYTENSYNSTTQFLKISKKSEHATKEKTWVETNM